VLDILADIATADARADAIIERARAMMKRSDSELDTVSLGAVASDVLALVKADAVKRGITLEVSLPESIPPVRADRVQLSQVLLNLVLNAMDSVSADATRERKVTIEGRYSGGGARVEVAVVDSGAGIAEELFPRLFQSFVTTKREGMGLGLVVSRTIVQAHGGDLRAENNAGRGATFRFTLATSS
jgi:two-component system sensor kinase FixL